MATRAALPGSWRTTCEDAGFEVRTEEVAPGRPNVWAVWEGDRPGKTLLFEAHTDVVTEGSAEEWEHPPFGAERDGGRIYGRGACDTKGNLAAAVVAVRAIRDSGVPFPGTLVLCHPVDEEGMMAGIKAFIENGHAEGVDAAVICEPEENQLCMKPEGRAQGRGHGARQDGARGHAPERGQPGHQGRAVRGRGRGAGEGGDRAPRRGPVPGLSEPHADHPHGPRLRGTPDQRDPRERLRRPGHPHRPGPVARRAGRPPGRHPREAEVGRPRLRRDARGDRGTPADRDPEGRAAGQGDGEGLRRI